MKRRPRRSTPAGTHLPVLLDATLAILSPRPGESFADCTAGYGGHASALLRAVGPSGKVIVFDLDPTNLARASQRLAAIGHPFEAHHLNFAGLATAVGGQMLDGVLADLGMSSMQVDDAERGFSYRRDGPLDMRMDPTRGRTASELLATISPDELARALRDLGDEPRAEFLAPRITTAARTTTLQRTGDLTRLVEDAYGIKNWKPKKIDGKYQTHPAARVFQVLRILVNREIANLEHLLRTLPDVLKSGGRVAIISFHSGEDRLVKAAFRAGLRAGVWSAVSDEPIRATFAEKTENPRSRSAKLRWAVRI